MWYLSPASKRTHPGARAYGTWIASSSRLTQLCRAPHTLPANPQRLTQEDCSSFISAMCRLSSLHVPLQPAAPVPPCRFMRSSPRLLVSGNPVLPTPLISLPTLKTGRRTYARPDTSTCAMVARSQTLGRSLAPATPAATPPLLPPAPSRTHAAPRLGLPGPLVTAPCSSSVPLCTAGWRQQRPALWVRQLRACHVFHGRRPLPRASSQTRLRTGAPCHPSCVRSPAPEASSAPPTPTVRVCRSPTPPLPLQLPVPPHLLPRHEHHAPLLLPPFQRQAHAVLWQPPIPLRDMLPVPQATGKVLERKRRSCPVGNGHPGCRAGALVAPCQLAAGCCQQAFPQPRVGAYPVVGRQAAAWLLRAEQVPVRVSRRHLLGLWECWKADPLAWVLLLSLLRVLLWRPRQAAGRWAVWLAAWVWALRMPVRNACLLLAKGCFVQHAVAAASAHPHSDAAAEAFGPPVACRLGGGGWG